MPAQRAELSSVHRSIELLQQLCDLFQQRREQLASRVDLTEQQWRVLEEIATEHFIPSMFAKSRESSAAAVSKTLRQLLDKDLVRVSVSADDGRQRHYELSGKGKKTMERLRAYRQHAIEAIWLDLHETDLRQFNRLGADLITRIEHYSTQQSADNGDKPARNPAPKEGAKRPPRGVGPRAGFAGRGGAARAAPFLKE